MTITHMYNTTYHEWLKKKNSIDVLLFPHKVKQLFDEYFHLGSSTTMGCVSSRIITKSASYRDEWNRYSFKRKGLDGVDEIVESKNSSDQFAALLHTTNAVARRLKEGPDLKVDEPDPNNAPSLEYTNPNPNNTEESERIANDIKTIITCELLDGLEEGVAVTTDSVGPSRSFRTVEDFDAMLAANRPPEVAESSVEVEHKNKIQRQGRAKEPERGSRRKAMAKDLAALNVSAFEFSRSSSLREWLSLGGQACSPGSYVTPRFGGFVSLRGAEEDGESAAAVFEPELVAQFEEAMEHLTIEEDFILDEIIMDFENCTTTKNVFP